MKPDTISLGLYSALCGKTIQPGALYCLADARLGFVYETDFQNAKASTHSLKQL